MFVVGALGLRKVGKDGEKRTFARSCNLQKDVVQVVAWEGRGEKTARKQHVGPRARGGERAEAACRRTRN